MAADAPYDVASGSVIAHPYRRHRPGRKVAVAREPRCRSGSKSLIFRTDAGYCRGFWSCFIERAEPGPQEATACPSAFSSSPATNGEWPDLRRACSRRGSALAGPRRPDGGDHAGLDVVGVTRDLDFGRDLRRVDDLLDVGGNGDRRVEDGQPREYGVVEAVGGEAMAKILISEEPGAALGVVHHHHFEPVSVRCLGLV